MEEAPLGILKYGNAHLKQPTEPVKEITMEVIRCGERLARAMRSVGGVGISAPQIGESYRMSLVSALKGTAPDPTGDSVLLINPVMIWHGDETETTPEGCLSVHASHWFASITRWRRVKIRYQDAALKEQTWTARGYEARILQHELDHLDGKMITDSLTRQQRRAVERIVATEPAKAARQVIGRRRQAMIERSIEQQKDMSMDVRDRDFDPAKLPVVIHR